MRVSEAMCGHACHRISVQNKIGGGLHLRVSSDLFAFQPTGELMMGMGAVHNVAGMHQLKTCHTRSWISQSGSR